MDKRLDIIYNKQYIIIVPSISEKIYKHINYTFGNAILMENNVADLNFFIKFINQNNFNEIILVDYQSEYEQLINSLEKEHIIKSIFTRCLGALSDNLNYVFFEKIMNLFNKKIITSIGLFDYNLYTILKNKYDNIYHLLLDVETEKIKCNSNNTIGIINNQNNNFHSYFNSMSAVKLIDEKFKINKPNNETKSFINTFKMEYTAATGSDLYNNKVNICINFSESSLIDFLQSMDNNIPCIIGNNSFLNKKLNCYLSVSSDDDIDEIAKKIKEVESNKELIIKEYKSFRTNYKEKSIKLKKIFFENNCINKYENHERLITIVVPIYNVDKYVTKSIDSILKAVNYITNYEILLINDGSTDKSKEIIEEYEKKYPKIIRVINQKNKGLGNVRNVALKQAKGKYIASIDSDDTINENFFKEAMEYLDEDIDIVIYDWKSIKENNEYFLTSAIEGCFDKKTKYEGLLYSTIMPSTCNKIIKKDLYNNINISFMEDKFEDLSINPIILLKAEKIKYINKPYYEYYLRSGSLNRTSSGYSMIDVIEELDKRIEKNIIFNTIDKDEFKYYTYSWRIEEYIINQLYELDDKNLKEYIDYIYSKLYDIMSYIFNNKYYINMLEKLSNYKLKEYIIERNNAFLEKKLFNFIKQKNKSDCFEKLTTYVIYYGDDK